MSYMLQFPPSPLPENVTSPPFVLFGINDLDAFSDLPTNIPLALVLHFAPVLRKWILPPPEELSTSAMRMALRTPYVGINILADMELEGLGCILARMMQLAHIKIPTGNYEVFQTKPSLLVSIAIHKAWMALELPPKGIEALHVQIQTTLMIGPAVTLFEVQGVWHNFSVDSPIQREMGLNFVRNYIDRLYPASESSAIRHWYLETTDRWSFFRELERQAPAFGDVQKETVKAANERKKQEELYIQKLFKVEKDTLASLEDEKEERHKARRERREKREREREERTEQRRSDRARSMSLDSVSSVETVIWNPLSSPTEEEDPTTPTLESGEPFLPHSKPVDSSVLADLLEAVTIDDQMQTAPAEADSVEFSLLEAIAAEKRNEEECVSASEAYEKVVKAERIALHETVGQQQTLDDGGDGDGDDFHDMMEYIPPDLTNLTKLKLKSTSNPVAAEKKYQPRRHALYETDVQQDLLVEQALTMAAAKFLSSKSLEKKMSQLPKYALSSSNVSRTTAIEGGTLNHRTLEEDWASLSTALERRTAQPHAELRGVKLARELEENILDGPDGLVYLQPAVYEGTR